MSISKDDWSKHSADFLIRNISMRAYSREFNLPYETFRYWHRKLKFDKPPLGSFVEVKLDNQQLSSSPITLIVNGVEVLVNKGFEREHLQEVLCCLREAKC